MERVHVPLDGPTLAQIDKEAKESGISRSKWLGSSVVQYLALRDQLVGQDPAKLTQELTHEKIKYEQLWKENQQLKRAEESARKDMDQVKKEIGPLKNQIASTTTELESMRGEMALLKKDLVHAVDTIGSRDKQISFLEAHIANLVQSIGQLTIKPSQEEAKKKGWWQFWK